MAILIANIGTSDLAIKIDDYYFPVGFDRNEPNLDKSGLTDDESAAWERDFRQSFIENQLCSELGEKLDFWFDHRNDLIHSAEGISKKRMKVLNEGSIKNSKKTLQSACEADQIRKLMADICSSHLRIVREEYRQKIIGKDADFYLYSGITNWVINQLKEEKEV